MIPTGFEQLAAIAIAAIAALILTNLATKHL